MKQINYGNLLQVSQENVWRLCDEEKAEGRVPQYTQIRRKFISPYSHLIQRYWAEWTAENEEFVASKKGSKYGYKKLYEQSLERADRLEAALHATTKTTMELLHWLQNTHPTVYKEWERKVSDTLS